jgi:dGTPase
LTDSFEGNAQTFRILTRLSIKASGQAKSEAGQQLGMNLTAASLAASVKYPWEHMKAKTYLGAKYRPRLSRYYSKKWGFYGDDATLWPQIESRAVRPGEKYSINAQIMDLADDVTYAVHDVHDYFRVGLVPLEIVSEGLNNSNDEFKQFDAYARSSLSMKPEVDFDDDEFPRAMRWLRSLPLPRRPYSDSDVDRGVLHAFESAAVRGVQEATSIRNEQIYTSKHLLLALEYLKELTWYYVINHPHLSSSQQGQRKVIRDLHFWLCEWAMECYPDEADEHRTQKVRRNLRRLPARFRDMLDVTATENNLDDQAKVSRAAVDFIVGLTDSEALDLHQRLGGNGLLGFHT